MIPDPRNNVSTGCSPEIPAMTSPGPSVRSIEVSKIFDYSAYTFTPEAVSALRQNNEAFFRSERPIENLGDGYKLNFILLQWLETKIV